MGRGKGKKLGIGIYCGGGSPCVAKWKDKHQRAEVIGDKHGTSRTTSRVCQAEDPDDICAVGAPTCPDNIKLADTNNCKPMALEPLEVKPKGLTVEEIGAAKTKAEKHLKRSVDVAVVTVPTYFDCAQRFATRDACRIAGLDGVLLFDESQAAALAYGFHKHNDAAVKNVLVLNLDTEALDAAVFNIQGKSIPQLRARLTDRGLGGNRFTDVLVKLCVDAFCELQDEKSMDIWSSSENIQNLRKSSENATWELSHNREVRKAKVSAQVNGKSFNTYVNLTDYENACKELFERCLDTVKQCLTNANMRKADIHDVLIIGGSAPIPEDPYLFRDFFNRKKLCSLKIEPGKAPACGAAILSVMVGGSVDTLQSVLGRSSEEAPIIISSIKRSFSDVTDEHEEKNKEKEKLDTSTGVINAIIAEPEIPPELIESGCKEEDIKAALALVKLEINQAEEWSKDNMHNGEVKASQYRQKLSGLMNLLKQKLPPILWEILKVALQLVSIVIAIL